MMLTRSLARLRLVIGVTGEIASGKSSACKTLVSFDPAKFVHVNCDELAHASYAPGELIYTDLVKSFGKDILAEAGADGVPAIDRQKLGDIVFKDKDAMLKLESIVWPAVRRLAGEAVAATPDDAVVFVEAALMFEADMISTLDRVIITYIDDGALVRRLRERGFDEPMRHLEQIRQRTLNLSTRTRMAREAGVPAYCIRTNTPPEVTARRLKDALTVLRKDAPPAVMVDDGAFALEVPA